MFARTGSIGSEADSVGAGSRVVCPTTRNVLQKRRWCFVLVVGVTRVAGFVIFCWLIVFLLVDIYIHFIYLMMLIWESFELLMIYSNNIHVSQHN